MPSAEQPVLRDGDLEVEALDDPEDGVRAFACRWQGGQVGRVELLEDDSGGAEVLWTVLPEPAGQGLASRALRLVASHAFDALGLQRLEAHLDADDDRAIHSALRAGLRREGRLRSQPSVLGGRRDEVVLGRLRDDPSPESHEGFIGMLDSTLPTKRTIAQGLLRNPGGEVLLCELTYKQEWDLPGGVVDPGESPARCLTREVSEELGLEVQPTELLAVNWLVPWRGWSDAMLHVFDLGVVGSDVVDRATLQRREIRALHWCGEEDLAAHVAPYNQRLIAYLSTHVCGTAYLEDGLPAL